VLTSGCGGGITFADLTAQASKVDSTVKVTPSQISELMRQLFLVSRTSPTDLAIELARAWGITLIGYARGQQIHVYSGEERIELSWHHQNSLPNKGLRATHWGFCVVRPESISNLYGFFIKFSYFFGTIMAG